MKAIKRNGSRGLPTGAEIVVVDNSGAKMIKVISVKGFKTVKRQLDCGGVGDLVTGNVLKGKPDMKHTLVKAVIVRQKQEYKRPDGTTIKFESNGCVVIKDEKSGSPKGTIIKGPIGKEVAERFPAVARIASIVA
jgi:large subunit ribosomal protein L14